MKNLELNWVYKTNDIPIYYTEETNGGGSFFLIDYIDYFKEYYPNKKFHNALEWCAGPGFIGFGMLSCDVCDNITFLETYDKAINLLQKTINDSSINNATIVHADNVQALDGKYDLIVGNPPHFCEYQLMQKNAYYSNHSKENWERIAVDTNWDIHREFFTNIKEHMAPDCLILLAENTRELPKITKVANECGFELKNRDLAKTTGMHVLAEYKYIL